MAGIGCGGSSTDDTSSEAAEEVTFTQVNQRVFATGCVFKACHGAQGPQGGLDLETDPYRALVDIVSGLSNKKYVTPGNPEASYVYEKIVDDTPTLGARMPLNSKLSEERIGLVRSWIAAGAKNN